MYRQITKSLAPLSCSRLFATSANASRSWGEFFRLPKETTQQSQSDQLAESETVYEMQIHSVKPDCMEGYLNEYKQFVERMHAKKTGAELAASWTCEIGPQDDAIHIWKFKGGYPVLNRYNEIYRSDPELVSFRKRRNAMLRSRNSHILLSFSFFPDMAPRKAADPSKSDSKRIFELRSYQLKPGTMIEWANHWARGIKCRSADDEAVGGFFTHIGAMHSVFHIWSYQNLEHRKQVRDSAWHKPGWDDCVRYTVPLVRQMDCRILIATPFSPIH